MAARNTYSNGIRMGIVKDNGCHHHPDCFTCPFEDCRLITGDTNETETTAAKKREAILLHGEGLKGTQIAQRLSVDSSRVSRWLRDVKQGKEVTGMKAYCEKCEGSRDLVRGTGSRYISTIGSVEVKGKFSCGHPASFITSAEQWARWSDGVKV